MKTFSVAVAVAIMLLTLICIQESAATATEIQELEKAVGNDSPAAVMSFYSWMMPDRLHRQKRRCRWCCDCCTPGVCGPCCKF